jgi:hypothetical protein
MLTPISGCRRGVRRPGKRRGETGDQHQRLLPINRASTGYAANRSGFDEIDRTGLDRQPFNLSQIDPNSNTRKGAKDVRA